MKRIEKYWKNFRIILSIISFIGGTFWSFHKIMNEFEFQNNKLDDAMRLSEKAIIWNKDIPNVERAEVCDLYLSAGYDSYTKKLCENVILNDSTIAQRSVT